MKQLMIAAFVVASLTLSACGTTKTKATTNDFVAVKQDAITLMVQPDVELKMLLASGIQETRADWSEIAQENLTAALENALAARSSKVVVMDAKQEFTPRQIQILKLNDAVTQTVMTYDYGIVALPNKKDIFDRTLGPGASLLVGDTGADYALMTTARGSYQSGGKIAMNLAMAAIGGPIQFGGQAVFTSLVDLKSGDIVWTNLATAASSIDMRKPEGAKKLVEQLLKEFPL